MSGKQGNSFETQKITTVYGQLVVLLVLAAVAAGGLHFYIADKQKTLTRASTAAYEQFALVQHISMLAAQYLRSRQEEDITAFKEASSAAYGKQEFIAPPILLNMKANGLDVIMRDFFQDSFNFASQRMSNDGMRSINSVIDNAQKQIPELWHSAVETYIAAEQKIIEILTYVCFALYGLIAVIASYASSSLFKPAMAQIEMQRENLERMAATDMLTGVYNRTMLFKVGSMLISGSHRHKQELSALAIDMDNCQQINDRYGRVAGDQAIKTVAKALNEILRTSDVIGRVGGEEFAVFLPATDEYRAEMVAEKLRAGVEAAQFSIKDTVVLLRVSIGVAQMQPVHKTPDDVLRDAQTALHKAKELGRNRVIAYSKMGSLPGAEPAPSAQTYAAEGAAKT